MKKVFIDCGYNKGEVSKEFYQKLGDSFEYIAFEANPYLYEEYKDKNSFVKLENKAVWVEDSVIDMYVVVVDKYNKKNPFTGASTLMKEKSKWNMKSHKKEEITKVQAFDFSKFILDNFDQNDEIIIKLDVEGAEYCILEKMIKTGSSSYINKLYVEFHDKKTGLSQKKIVEELKKQKVELYRWR